MAEQPKSKKIQLTDGLPKKSPAEIYEELKTIVIQENENYFPENGPRMQRLTQNLNLFDRDGDGFLKYPELKELMISTNMMLPEDELEDLYKEALKSTGETKGVSIDQVKIFVCKKIREEDKRYQLFEAFQFVAGEDQEYIESEPFKELLMTLGSRWTEEQADEFLKDCDPKGEGRFQFDDFVTKLMKR